MSEFDWFTFDKVRALIALCTFLISLAGYFGYSAEAAKQEVADTRAQVTNVVNYYYSKDCKNGTN